MIFVTTHLHTSYFLLPLLSFVGFTALYGGWSLMIDPSGKILNMSVTKMRLSPFEDYFVPGAMLFFILGLGSLSLLPLVLKGKDKSTSFLIVAGVTVSGWIIVQMIMMLDINWLHGVYISIAFALIYLGIKAASKTAKN